MEERDPSALRKVYFQAWQKAEKSQPLTPMEALIVDIIQRHPEYQPIFRSTEDFESLQMEKFALDHNPFFHLALHVTVAEQVSADRPAGIRALYQRLMQKYSDQTQVEHKMIECLAKLLVESFQRDQSANEEIYLEAIKKLI